MRINQRLHEVERAAGSLALREYLKYLEFEEIRSRQSTVLFLLMAFSAFAAAGAVGPRLTEAKASALLAPGFAMTVCLVLMASSCRYALGAIARVAFLFWCSQAFAVLIEDSRHALFWQLAICSIFLVAMSPLHYEPISQLAAAILVMQQLLLPQMALILDHRETGWMFCLVITSALFGAVMNAHFFLARTRLYKVGRELAEMAYRDGLTKVNNRRGFLEDFARHTRSEPARPMALLLLDADDFKRINDVHGHDVGDEVLKAIGSLIGKLEGTLTCGRLGGEEFGVLVLGSAEQAAQLAETLVERAAALNVSGVRFTVSIGVATMLAGTCFETAMRTADQALYRAKRGGKNRVVVVNEAAARQASGHGGRA